MQEDTDITAVAEGNMSIMANSAGLNLLPASVEVCHTKYRVESGLKNSEQTIGHPSTTSLAFFVFYLRQGFTMQP